MRWLLALLLTATLVRAEGERPGDFDYYVMALSWSPTWCALTGDARGSPQCDTAHGWILHGLWPQYHRGYPSACQTAATPPTRAMTGAMADIMGTPGLAWHQWKKHGTCSGLSAHAYLDLSRAAYDGVNRPQIFRKLDRAVTLPAALIEKAFLQANPQFDADSVTVTCRDHHIQEVRLCLSKDMQPVPCGRDVIKDCSLTDALFTPIR